MNKVILSLGSNLGDKINILNEAVVLLNEKVGKVVKVSKLYESEPWGFIDDNYFYNNALSLQTEKSPFEILRIIKEIEIYFKRIKLTKNYEARTLDIDIIFYGSAIINTPDLKIPHLFSHLRKFVLLPVLDIEENITHPVYNCQVRELLENCPDNNFIKTINYN